jgi:hypothetical protein
MSPDQMAVLFDIVNQCQPNSSAGDQAKSNEKSIISVQGEGAHTSFPTRVNVPVTEYIGVSSARASGIAAGENRANRNTPNNVRVILAMASVSS